MNIKHVIIYMIVLIIIETILTIYRHYRRIRDFKIAKKLSKKLNKPLLVIGSPDNGGFNSIFGRSYECGDLCIDLVGCKKCEHSIKGDALNVLKKIPSNSHVIYESCTLEYIHDYDISILIEEIKRVSGGNYVNTRVLFSFLMLYYIPSLWTYETNKQKYVKTY